ncbi:hypothetical protein LRS10_13500 [Phenylobacterium sp. J426]|uniref:hypothetical protein n=1 Tax=Phenylobacterium sp. J426 TaxID=2898439 RepID=UPI002150F1C8|nr:hypothetical protein [Phenylobacterium sp. J426]MCR5875109.1 hypothetical protein [Phenylobacterium sp. J426]
MGETRRIGWKRAVGGAVLALAGSAALTWMVWAMSTSDAWAMRLGLAPAAVYSAVAQAMVFSGVALMWSAFRAGR